MSLPMYGDVSVEHSLWIVMSLCGRLLLDCDVTPYVW